MAILQAQVGDLGDSPEATKANAARNQRRVTCDVNVEEAMLVLGANTVALAELEGQRAFSRKAHGGDDCGCDACRLVRDQIELRKARVQEMRGILRAYWPSVGAILDAQSELEARRRKAKRSVGEEYDG